MRLFYEAKTVCPLREGEMLTAMLRLAPREAPVELTARVQYLTTVTDHTTHIGMQFEGLDDTPEGRALRQKLERYVAAREREELRRARLSMERA